MNWKEHHHLYIGFLMAIGCLGVVAVNFGLHDVRACLWWLIGAGAGIVYAIDDALQHGWNMNTPCHRLDVLLKKWGLYQAISDWLDKYIFKKRE